MNYERRVTSNSCVNGIPHGTQEHLAGLLLNRCQHVGIPTVTFLPRWDSSTLTRPPSPPPRFFRVIRGRVSRGCPSHMSSTATSFPSRAATPQLQATA